MSVYLLALAALLAACHVRAQNQDTFPHAYPGMPSGDYSPTWQAYFEVTEPLPNVTFDVGRSFAGNIAVNRPNHPNDTLFFWGFEKSNGSLTAAANSSDEPWAIWLNGGPGSSSMVGLHFENGPIHINPDYSVVKNDKTWTQLSDYIYVDQPVGVGFGTADPDGLVADEDQMGTDFVGFLENLVKVFPSLRTRPLYLTGESYAGMYIPYITKAIFATQNPPVKLGKIVMGDGTVGSGMVYELVPVIPTLETYPQIIGYSTEVFEYFKEQSHLCGYDLNLTYPGQPMPPLKFQEPTGVESSIGLARRTRGSLKAELASRYAARNTKLRKRDRELARELWTRDLSGRANGTIDVWYGCDIYSEMLDYAVNFTFPWSENKDPFDSDFDIYNVPDGLFPEPPMDATVFLNNNQTRAAIHAPTSKDWAESISYNFSDGGPNGFDPSPEPMVFLNELAAGMDERGIAMVLYYGNDDTLVPHTGGQVVIQNTSFGGAQGFTRVPSTPWQDDDGNFAGVVHQERNWTYVLIDKAGHLVGYDNPGAAFNFARDFVFGSSQTGLLQGSTVNGGEDTDLSGPALRGQDGIDVGSITTSSTYTAPSATIASWNSYIATAVPTAPPLALSSKFAKANAAAPTHTSRSRTALWCLLFVMLSIEMN